MHQAALDIPTPTVKLNKHGTSQTNVNGNHIKTWNYMNKLKEYESGESGCRIWKPSGESGCRIRKPIVRKGVCNYEPKKNIR